MEKETRSAEEALAVSPEDTAAQRAADDYKAEVSAQADEALKQANALLEEARRKNVEAEETLSRAKSRAEHILAEAQKSAEPRPVEAPVPETTEEPRRRGLFGRGKQA